MYFRRIEQASVILVIDPLYKIRKAAEFIKIFLLQDPRTKSLAVVEKRYYSAIAFILYFDKHQYILRVEIPAFRFAF